MILLIAIGFIGESVFSASELPFFLNNGQACNGDACTKPNPHLFHPLSKLVRPCDNFYEYSCVEWTTKSKKPSHEPVWNQWVSASHELYRREVDILTSKAEDDLNLAKAQNFYQACLEADKYDTKNLRSLRALVKEFGGWPVAMDRWNGSQTYDWLKQSAKLTKVLGISPALKLHVDIDFSEPGQHALYIEPGNLIFPKYILTNPSKYKKLLTAYENWISQTIEHLFKKKSHKEVRQEARKIVQFESNLAKLHKHSKTEWMTIHRLTKKIPLNWVEALNILFEGVHQVHINGNNTVIIRNYSYLRNIYHFFDKLDKKVIANYLIWSAVRDLSRQTSKFLRFLSFLIDKTILGVKSDLSRPVECITKINDYLSHTITPKYANLYLQPNILSQVEQMIKVIKTEFVSSIQNSQWLSDSAKTLSVAKARNVRYFVGFPEWVQNENLTKRYYEGLEINDNHFLNILKVKGFGMAKQLAKLREPVTEAVWPSTVFEVNAYYSILQNSIFIPLGLLLAPFFQSDRPAVYNFGALGTLIGHEFSHSLDISARLPDKNGKMRERWLPEDIKTYRNRTKCFQQQPTETGTNFLTLAENIADSVGLDLSLAAYRKLSSGKRELQNSQKLFFISFAQMWCEILANNDIFAEEEHAPVRDRVNLTVSNSDEFYETFDCVATSNKCQLW